MVFVACGHFGISNAAPQRTFRRTFSNSNNRRSSFSSGRRSFTRNGGSRTFIRSGRAFGTTGGGSSFSSNSASATLPNSATSFSSSSSSSSSGQLFPSNVPSGILSTGGTILGGLIRQVVLAFYMSIIKKSLEYFLNIMNKKSGDFKVTHQAPCSIVACFCLAL